jgi:hypothetical protein
VSPSREFQIEKRRWKYRIAGGDLMKLGTSALIATAIFLAGIGAATAQTVIYGSQAYYGGRAAPPPVHAPFDGALPSYEVAAILRSGGYLPLGGPIRRGNFYVVAAAHPSGDEGRVVIDAFTGRIVRFIPPSDVTRASRGDEMVLVYQGPTFPPRDGARPVPPPPALAARPGGPLFPAVRGVPPRPPGAVPNVASRTPSSGPVTPKPRPQGIPAKPDTAQAPPAPAPIETKPAAASPPLLSKSPLEKSPSVQPTKPLPPVQTME